MYECASKKEGEYLEFLIMLHGGTVKKKKKKRKELEVPRDTSSMLPDEKEQATLDLMNKHRNLFGIHDK